MGTGSADRGGRRRLVVGISGASGAIYGVRLLEVLRELEEVETHLIISQTGAQTLEYETGRTVDEVAALASHTHPFADLTAAVASGSFRTSGMVVAPCSIKTLSAVANSYGDNLVARAADVTLKERRRLVLVVRETPLHVGHLRLMLQAAENGAILLPPAPAFYHHPKTVEDIVDQTVGGILDLFDLEVPGLLERWTGIA